MLILLGNSSIYRTIHLDILFRFLLHGKKHGAVSASGMALPNSSHFKARTSSTSLPEEMLEFIVKIEDFYKERFK
jgi:hypothetical protein